MPCLPGCKLSRAWSRLCWRTGAHAVRGIARLLCALLLLTHGCASSAGRTSGLPPAPATPGAVVTATWMYEGRDGPVVMNGDWLHLPAAEAGELLLWIETAETL